MSRLLVPFIMAMILASSQAAYSSGNAGFLYGTLTLNDGEQLTGFLRWESEEGFWDDLFQSRRRELPWFENIDLEFLHKERERRYFETHGMLDRLLWTMNNNKGNLNPSRLFVARFGDLALIEVPDDDEVALTMRDGERFLVSGYANDVSSDILVYPGGDTEAVEVDWDDLTSIRFAPAPAGTVPYARRLHGHVTFRGGELVGYIQWDKSECVTTDILDSSHDDIEMGRIRSIARDQREGCRVELIDGEKMTLRGTNDVDKGNRGVMVEAPGLGRVTIPWSRFEAVTFSDDAGCGPDYAAFAVPRPLRGTLTTQDGRRHTGRLVYDLEEAFTWDVFNGIHNGCEYDIPFGLIAAIEPTGGETCRVTLGDGRDFEFGDDQDAGLDNAGVLVFEAGAADPIHVPWSQLARITFEHPQNEFDSP